MFLENSRYYGWPTMKRKLKDGREVLLVQPRLLPAPSSAAVALKANDRLDILALRRYQDGTRFWHIADANSETEARRLTEPREASTTTPLVPTIQVPEK